MSDDDTHKPIQANPPVARRPAIILIGDPMITSDTLRAAVHDQIGDRFELLQEDWHAAVDDVVELNRIIERGGPASVSVPRLDHHSRANVIGALTHFYPLSAQQLDQWPDLRFVATVRSGIENIDSAALQRRSVPLLRNTGRNANAVAEFAVGAMLAHSRRLGESHHLIRTGGWRHAVELSALRELSNLTIGLIGFGAVGSLVARRLSGFEPRLLVYDPFLDRSKLPTGASPVGLHRLLRESDIISMHARSGPDTFHLLGTAELDLIRRETVIINTARADLIDEDALIDRLRDSRVGGAALDVFSLEPLPADHLLRSLPNVTLSPHIAGLTMDARTNAPQLIARRIAGFLDTSPIST